MRDKQHESRYSPRAALVAIGVKLQQFDLLGPIRELVKIPQKTIKYSPLDKLLDTFITILAGAKGLVEINTRLRTDKALQRAFGRQGCAEQSVVQETLNAATTNNILEMEQAFEKIYRAHALAYRHNYKAGYQLLDIDVTGMPCGPKAEQSTKGYFDKEIRYGRQLGRVIAAHYEEIVVDRLYAGHIQLSGNLRELVEAAERVLELDESKRERTIVRVDAGGGSYDLINWMLERGYQLHCKEYSSKRAEKVAQTVTEWFEDTKIANRQFGWAKLSNKTDSFPYHRPVKQLVCQVLKKNGQVTYTSLLISTLESQEVITLLGLPVDTVKDPAAVIRAYAHMYDLRSGCIEIEIKEDKQGIGLTKRSKKKFAAQQMIMLLGALAHNVLVWTRYWLAPDAPRLARYGILRLVRDVFGISGLVRWDQRDFIIAIVLDSSNRISYELARALRRLLPGCIKVSLGVS